ncbi:MAG: YfiR family protein [Chthoniobacteraceae bacterium]
MNLQSVLDRNGFLLRIATRLVLSSLAFVLGVRTVALRAETGVSEYDLKAAFLSKFVQFVKWPKGASGTIGILGDDPFGGKLEKALRGRLKIMHSRQPEDLMNCQIVFVSKSERGSASAIIARLGNAHVLTVGDSDGFARQGGVIGFTMAGDKVRFEINTAAERRAGLIIDPTLKELATRIFGS